MNVFKLIEDNGLTLHGDIEHFAELIRQEEREACAKVCEETTAAWTQHLYNSGCVDCAAAIRARGQAWEKRVVKTEHDRAVELGQAYERGWNAALAQQEPVAWASSLDFDDDDQEIIPAKDKGKLGTSNCNIPLYTTPPKKEWVGLTDEDMEALFLNKDGVRLARYIEAKLKEKNT